MLFYRLGNVVDTLAAGAAPQDIAANGIVGTTDASSAAPSTFVESAQIAEVQGAGCLVYVGGVLVFADQATDEPFQAGQMVYVSQTQAGGYIIHGSVKS